MRKLPFILIKNYTTLFLAELEKEKQNKSRGRRSLKQHRILLTVCFVFLPNFTSEQKTLQGNRIEQNEGRHKQEQQTREENCSFLSKPSS